MTTIVDVVMNFETEMKLHLEDLPCVSSTRLGLHAQAGTQVYVDGEALVVRKRDDQRFRYFTEFEDECRVDAGAYVLYTVEDQRVSNAIDFYWDLAVNDLAPRVIYDPVDY